METIPAALRFLGTTRTTPATDINTARIRAKYTVRIHCRTTIPHLAVHHMPLPPPPAFLLILGPQQSSPPAAKPVDLLRVGDPHTGGMIRTKGELFEASNLALNRRSPAIYYNWAFESVCQWESWYSLQSTSAYIPERFIVTIFSVLSPASEVNGLVYLLCARPFADKPLLRAKSGLSLGPWPPDINLVSRLRPLIDKTLLDKLAS